MKRDIDYFRELISEFVDSEESSFSTHRTMGMSQNDERRNYHIDLLSDAGLIVFLSEDGDTFRVTNDGQDFVDAIRNDTTWNKTKSIAQEAGGMTVSLLRDIAVALIKEKAAEVIGVRI